MSPRAVLRLSGFVFSAIAIGHLVRVLLQVPASLNGWAVPHGVSVAGLVIAGMLAVLNFKAAGRVA